MLMVKLIDRSLFIVLRHEHPHLLQRKIRLNFSWKAIVCSIDSLNQISAVPKPYSEMPLPGFRQHGLVESSPTNEQSLFGFKGLHGPLQGPVDGDVRGTILGFDLNAQSRIVQTERPTTSENIHSSVRARRGHLGYPPVSSQDRIHQIR